MFIASQFDEGISIKKPTNLMGSNFNKNKKINFVAIVVALVVELALVGFVELELAL